MKQAKKKDGDIFFQDLKYSFGIVRFIFRSLFNRRDKVTFVALPGLYNLHLQNH